MQGHWFPVDGDIGPQDILLYLGLTLYQSMTGYISLTLHITNIGSLQGIYMGGVH